MPLHTKKSASELSRSSFLSDQSGSAGGAGGDAGGGQCPAAGAKPAEECAGTVANCWSPGNSIPLFLVVASCWSPGNYIQLFLVVANC